MKIELDWLKLTGCRSIFNRGGEWNSWFTVWKLRVLSAKGAECDSPGQRPGYRS